MSKESWLILECFLFFLKNQEGMVVECLSNGDWLDGKVISAKEYYQVTSSYVFVITIDCVFSENLWSTTTNS